MDNLLGRDNESVEDINQGQETDGDNINWVTPMPGMGVMGMGSPGTGIGAFPVAGSVSDEGAEPDDNMNANIADSPDSFAGGGATSPGHDKNADLLDR